MTWAYNEGRRSVVDTGTLAVPSFARIPLHVQVLPSALHFPDDSRQKALQDLRGMDQNAP